MGISLAAAIQTNACSPAREREDYAAREVFLSGTLERAKARYGQARDASRRQAILNLADELPVDCSLGDWSNRAFSELKHQWQGARTHDVGGWDWNEMHRKYREVSVIGSALWTADRRLSALAMGRATGESVCLEFVEADPRTDCPLKGWRLPIFIELMACYAQELGKREVRVIPANTALGTLYVRFGFVLETPRKQTPYYRREV